MRKLLCLWLAITCFTLPLARASAGVNDLAIIVGKNNVLDDVTSADVLKIFRAEKRKGADGVKFVIVMRDPGAAERALILAKLYGMGEDDYSKYFLQATFVGMVQSAPRELPSAAAVLQFVAATPGAIGYVRAGDLNDSVKALKIDGKAAGDPDYKLNAK